RNANPKPVLCTGEYKCAHGVEAIPSVVYFPSSFFYFPSAQSVPNLHTLRIKRLSSSSSARQVRKNLARNLKDGLVCGHLPAIRLARGTSPSASIKRTKHPTLSG